MFPTFLLLLAPWLAGGTLSWLIATKFKLSNGAVWFSFGVGSFLSYVMITGALALAPADQRSGYALWLCLACLGVFVFALLGSFHHWRSFFATALKQRSGELFFLPTALLLISFIFQIQLLPTVAWDVVDFWALRAVSIVEDSMLGVYYPFEDYASRHPPTGVIFIAWVTWICSSTNNFEWAWLPWMAIALSIVFMFIGVSLHRYPQKYAFAACVSYIFLSTPLMENHILLGGYQEIFLCASVVTSIGLLYFFVIRPEWRRLTLVLLSAFIPMLFKNIGAIYSVAILLTLFCMKMLRNMSHKTKLVLFSIIAMTIAIELLSQSSLVYEVIKLALSYDRESNPIVFGGRTMFLNPIDPLTLINVEIHSKLINTSFSLSVIIFFIVSSLLFTRQVWSEYLALPFIGSVFIVIGLSAMLGSLMLNHALMHALPTSDTGHSRFALPIVTLVSFCVVGAFDYAGRKRPLP